MPRSPHNDACNGARSLSQMREAQSPAGNMSPPHAKKKQFHRAPPRVTMPRVTPPEKRGSKNSKVGGGKGGGKGREAFGAKSVHLKRVPKGELLLLWQVTAHWQVTFCMSVRQTGRGASLGSGGDADNKYSNSILAPCRSRRHATTQPNARPRATSA